MDADDDRDRDSDSPDERRKSSVVEVNEEEMSEAIESKESEETEEGTEEGETEETGESENPEEAVEEEVEAEEVDEFEDAKEVQQQPEEKKPVMVQVSKIAFSDPDVVLSFRPQRQQEAIPTAGMEKDKIQPTTATKCELSTKQKEDIREAFNSFDINGTGFMAVQDLKIALRALGFEPRKNEIKKIVEKVDKHNTGCLCFTAFMDVICIKLAEKDSRDEILKAFKLFDKDQTGYITFENLRQIATELGEGLNDEEIKEMIEEADMDNDGAVNQEEFFRIMKKTSLY